MKTKMLIAGTLLVAMFGGRYALAGSSGVAGFAQLKDLVGHWETEKSSTNQATLDLQLTSGGTAVIEKAQNGRAGENRGNDHSLLSGWRSAEVDALLHGGQPADHGGQL